MVTSLPLIDWEKNRREKGQQSYVLIDSAQAENSHLQLEKWQIPFVSLFEGTPEESLLEIAPLLIPLSDLSAVPLEKVCKWAMKLAERTPCLSWMASTLATESFADHLRNFHTVKLSEGQTMMMRWYDTRILAVWLGCLTPAQAQQFTGGMLCLQCVNRFGESTALYSAEIPGPPPGALPLGEPLITLSDKQYGVLVDAGETDVLVGHLRRVITDETNKLPARLLFEFVAKYQQRAIQAGVDDIDRQTQYVLLALYTSGKGVEHPACIELIKSPPKSLDDFYHAMQALPEEAWEAGPPLWDVHDPI
jgi:hypothetical protein